MGEEGKALEIIIGGMRARESVCVCGVGGWGWGGGGAGRDRDRVRNNDRAGVGC